MAKRNNPNQLLQGDNKPEKSCPVQEGGLVAMHRRMIKKRLMNKYSRSFSVKKTEKDEK